MTTLREGDLRLTLPDPVVGRTFDNPQHGLSHCGLKAVDWILELPGRIYFVEVKDPDDPEARRHKHGDDFVGELQAGKLTRKLAAKFRDTFLYEWACDRVDKPINYIVIVASKALDDPQLLHRAEDLKRMLPVGTPAGWSRAIAHGCFVFNIAEWNEVFPDYPLSRHSAAGVPAA